MTSSHPSEESLSRHAAGDLDARETREIAEHLVGRPACREVHGGFAELTRLADSAESPVIEDAAARRVLARVQVSLAVEGTLTGGGAREAWGSGAAAAPEVMTLEEAASYLRVAFEDLERELDSLPFFEIGGQLRLRRDRLLEWIQARERRQRGERSSVGRF